MKKISVIILAVVCLMVSVSAVLPAYAADDTFVRGDADGDGQVTIYDVTLIQSVLADLKRDYGGIIKRNCDVDGNGLGITDVTNIQRYLAEYANTFHINESETVPATTAPQTTIPQPTRDEYELPIIPNW